jgi:hypothetical protein
VNLDVDGQERGLGMSWMSCEGLVEMQGLTLVNGDLGMGEAGIFVELGIVGNWRERMFGQ